MRKFPGINCVLCALFDPQEQLDRVAMVAQVAYATNVSAHGITVLGLATEGNKLMCEERGAMAESW